LSTIKSISTKRTIASNLNSLNIKTITTYDVENPDAALGQAQTYDAVNPDAALGQAQTYDRVDLQHKTF